MALHVDIVKNEWLAGMQHAVARVLLIDGQIVIDSSDPDRWRASLQRAVGINPDERPQDFLAALPERLNGTYLFATEPHEDDACPFIERPVAYLRREVREPTAATA